MSGVMEYRGNGVMEYWSIELPKRKASPNPFLQNPITPILHYSNSPFLHHPIPPPPHSSSPPMSLLLLLLDIGNTNTHLGLANASRVLRHVDIPTTAWFDGSAVRRLRRFAGRTLIGGVAICSVVP